MIEGTKHSASEPAHHALDMVMRYHQETKHHFSRFARAPGSLDWANQPDPFRRYEGAPLFALPLVEARRRAGLAAV